MGEEVPNSTVTTPRGAVFLSYASQDAEVARAIAEALRGAGIEVFLDQSELRGGDAWDHKIRREIHDCALFMPVISKHTQDRLEGYFRHEWNLAVERAHHMARQKSFLLPVVVDGTSDREALVPDEFRSVQWTRLPGGGMPPAFIERILRLLSPGSPPAAAIRAQIPASRVTKGFHLGVPAAFVVLAALAYLSADKLGILSHQAPTSQAAKIPAPEEAVSEKSVAVLPFVDMSAKKDQEYFADGLSEELIDQLAQSDLKVIARTSSFHFKGRNDDVRTIGKLLGVANLLEGSVRTSGKTMRITAQLVKVSDGSHLWSDTYDRNMGDIFEVQDSIAKAVTTALQAMIRAQTSSADHKSSNPQAYAAYLRGVYFQYKFSEKDSQRSSEALQDAVRLDPRFALAWAALARTYENEAINGWMPPEQAHAEARRAVQQSLGIDPTLAYAHAQLMAIEANSFNPSASRAEGRTVRQLDPDDLALLNHDAIDAANSGRLNEAIDLYTRARRNDPLNMRWLDYLFELYLLADRVSDAESTVKEMLAINPGRDGTHCSLGYVLLAKNSPDAALAAMNGERDEETRNSCVTDALWALGRRTEANAILAARKAKYADSDAYDLACSYAARNDKDEAFYWIDRAYRNKEPAVIAIGAEACLRNLRSDPRFAAMLRKVG